MGREVDRQKSARDMLEPVYDLMREIPEHYFRDELNMPNMDDLYENVLYRMSQILDGEYEDDSSRYRIG